MTFFRKLVEKKKDFIKLFFQKNGVIKKETKVEKVNLKKEEFDIYKYFLLPVEERNNYKW
tara:strand:+ start:8880 stop:9059 length:180 start_codon:yes stop_codon:yes gene_type:complete